MTDSLYALLDHDNNRHWVLGLIADAHADAGEWDEERAVRWIRRAGKWPSESVGGQWVDWWTCRITTPHASIGRILGHELIDGTDIWGQYEGPKRHSAAIRDLVRAWVRVVQSKREQVARRKEVCT